MKKSTLLISVALIATSMILIVVYLDTSKAVESEIIIESLDTPWAIDFLPDGRMIFTERMGTVSVYDGQVTVVGRVNASENGEAGLLGLAVDPDFGVNNFVYLYYTHDTANRVSRFILTSDRLINETVLLDGIPSASNHDGGELVFGPDGYLYVSTGDAGDADSAQDLNSLAGKILRMNKNGSVPPDNPFSNYVYSYGHRNPEGLVFGDEMYASEHGPSSHDEINVIIKGGNYGWPSTCDEQPNGTVLPMKCYTSFTLAPAGIAYVSGVLYVGGLRGQQLLNVNNDSVLISDMGRIREVVYHDGYLYFSTSNKDGRGSPRAGDDKIARIKI